MRDYWLSTPRFTCWFRIRIATGKIIDCAPILKRTWMHRHYVSLLSQVRGGSKRGQVRCEVLGDIP